MTGRKAGHDAFVIPACRDWQASASVCASCGNVVALLQVRARAHGLLVAVEMGEGRTPRPRPLK